VPFVSISVGTSLLTRKALEMVKYALEIWGITPVYSESGPPQNNFLFYVLTAVTIASADTWRILVCFVVTHIGKLKAS
jgi:hypothetical protein